MVLINKNLDFKLENDKEYIEVLLEHKINLQKKKIKKLRKLEKELASLKRE